MLPAVWRHICRHQLAESARTRRSGDISNGPATSAAASASTAAACARRRRSPAAAHSLRTPDYLPVAARTDGSVVYAHAQGSQYSLAVICTECYLATCM